jgi:hypothetical protein
MLASTPTSGIERPDYQVSGDNRHGSWLPLFVTITRNLRILAWNTNSVADKKAELELFLQASNIDVAAVCVKKLLPKYRFTIPGFKKYRLDRNRFGGGVMLLVNANLRHDTFLLPQMSGLEATTVCLQLQNHNKLIFVSVYLPPTAIITQTDLDAIFAPYDAVIHSGDLNCKHVSWNNVSVNKNGSTLHSYCLNNSINNNYPNQPTHFPYNSYPSILHIAHSQRCITCKPLPIPALSSDHKPIVFKVHLHPILSTPKLS